MAESLPGTDDHGVTGMLRGTGAVTVAVGLLLAAEPASGQQGRVAASATRTAASAAAPLSVHVSVSKHRVRIGHRLRVTYAWTDGNGDLVDTNHIGTMAIRVLRNVSCDRAGHASHPITGDGGWWYRPQAVFTGAFTHSVKIRVGFNVRTGGCAPIEEATDTEVVTVLPAQ